MSNADRLNIVLGMSLIEALDRKTDELNKAYGLRIQRTDLIRMATSILIKNVDAAIEGREIYTSTDIEMALLDLINEPEK